jgi:hypothetical protein
MSDEIKSEPVVEVKPAGELTTAALDEVVGGVSSGKHIKKIHIELLRASGDSTPGK